MSIDIPDSASSFPVSSWKNSSKISSPCPGKKKKKKSQHGSGFLPQILATPLPLEEKTAKEARCPRLRSYNQTESDPWCVNRDATACWPDSRGLSSRPTSPLPGCGEACLARGNNGTKRPRRSCRNLFDRDCPLMNQAPETISTSSLHKYPWAQSRAFSQARACYWEAGRKVLGGGGRREGLKASFFMEGGPGLLRAEKGKGFSARLP